MSSRPFIPETSKLLAEREQRLLSALDTVLARTRVNRSTIRETQIADLKKMLEHAFENIPFYRDKYTQAGFDPSTFRSLDDLPKIPFVTKEELRREDPARLSWRDDVDDSRILSSSGSTGIPLKIVKSDDAIWYFTARNMALYYDWCERKPIANVLYFLDLHPGTIDCALADFLRTTVLERVVSITEPQDVLIRKLEDVEPEFVSSYPSTMRNIATELLRRAAPNTTLRLLHLTSEMLDATTRKTLGQAFPNARIVETYTSTEAGLIGFPCKNGDRLHLAEDSAIYEIVDADGKPTDDTGELVVTDLINSAMPLIRYRGLGDVCRWNQTPCSCGSPFRSIHHLEGRSVDSIRCADGSLLSPYAVSNALEKIAGICQFQIVQRGIGQFHIRIVRDRRSDTNDERLRDSIQSAVAAASNERVSCDTVFVDAILRGNARHKIPLVINEMPRAE